MLLGLALLADILTTRLAVSAGAVETNTLYGANPNMPMLIGTHITALIAAAALLHWHPDVAPMFWGATGVMAGVSLWNLRVWRKQKGGA
ncbi:MAG: hypothetical protein KGL42_12200 [Betaproteobacteria bacterium]|nr:hypothetical protein [Betaproteobacteria bacterium]